MCEYSIILLKLLNEEIKAASHVELKNRSLTLGKEKDEISETGEQLKHKKS